MADHVRVVWQPDVLGVMLCAVTLRGGRCVRVLVDDESALHVDSDGAGASDGFGDCRGVGLGRVCFGSSSGIYRHLWAKRRRILTVRSWATAGHFDSDYMSMFGLVGFVSPYSNGG